VAFNVKYSVTKLDLKNDRMKIVHFF